jgi:LPXTG-motif cell wall-anchored protein
MRKATFAKLSLTALVGLGTLVGQASAAEAGPPQPNGGVIIAQPTTTTMKPLKAAPAEPKSCGAIDCMEATEVDPQADLPVVQPEPQPEPPQDAGCNPNVLCDEITSDPGCTWTHGCPQPEPECPDIVASCDLTSDPGCTITHGECDGDDEGTDGGGTDGGDEGTDDGGDEDGTDGEDGTTGGGGTLPKTGAEMATWAVAGLGLTGLGAALRKLGKRAA